MNWYGVNLSHCRAPATMSKKSAFLSGEWTFAFVLKHHYSVNNFFRETRYVRSICFIFPLCIESNALEKSSNKSVATRFLSELLLWFDRSLESVILWIDLSGNHSDFFKEFSQFQVRRDCEAEHYKPMPVFLGDSQVTSLEEGKDAAFCLSLYCVLIRECNLLVF